MRAAYQCQLLFLLLSQTKGEGKKKNTVERQLDLTHTKKKMTWILNFLDVHISIVDLTNSAGKKNIYTLVSFLELFYFFLPLLLLQFGAWVLSLSLLFCGYVSSSCYSQ